jgi:hypothetical protein
VISELPVSLAGLAESTSLKFGDRVNISTFPAPEMFTVGLSLFPIEPRAAPIRLVTAAGNMFAKVASFSSFESDDDDVSTTDEAVRDWGWMLINRVATFGIVVVRVRWLGLSFGSTPVLPDSADELAALMDRPPRDIVDVLVPW